MKEGRRGTGMYMRMVIEPVAMGMAAVDAARAAVGYAQGKKRIERP